MKFPALHLSAIALIGAIGVMVPQVSFAEQNEQIQADSAIQAGYALAKKRCGTCHAIEKTGKSPLKAAPPFRTLGQRYPIESLEEALAEGISVGHPNMPSTPWEPADIDRLISYLKTINTEPVSTPTP